MPYQPNWNTPIALKADNLSNCSIYIDAYINAWKSNHDTTEICSHYFVMAAIFSLKNLNQPRKHWQLLIRCRNKTEFGDTRGGFVQGKGHIPFMVSVKQVSSSWHLTWAWLLPGESSGWQQMGQLAATDQGIGPAYPTTFRPPESPALCSPDAGIPHKHSTHTLAATNAWKICGRILLKLLVWIPLLWDQCWPLAGASTDAHKGNSQHSCCSQ